MDGDKSREDNKDRTDNPAVAHQFQRAEFSSSDHSSSRSPTTKRDDDHDLSNLRYNRGRSKTYSSGYGRPLRGRDSAGSRSTDSVGYSGSPSGNYPTLFDLKTPPPGLVADITAASVHKSVPSPAVAPSLTHSLPGDSTSRSSFVVAEKLVSTTSSSSWGKPSKKSSLEDDIPDENQLEFAKLNPARSESKEVTEMSSLVSAVSSGSYSDSKMPPVESPRVRRKSSVRFSDSKDDKQLSSILGKHEVAGFKTGASNASSRAFQSKQEHQRALMSPEDIEESRGLARNLREATGGDPVNTEIVESLMTMCKQEQVKIRTCIETGLNQGVDVGFLLELNENLMNATETGEKVLSEASKDQKPSPQSPDVDELVKKKDIFTLICTLRAQQDNRRLDAALALMRFARAAEGGDQEQLRIRDEIRSSGGMHSLLTLFRTRGISNELKIVTALAVAYLLPAFRESAVESSSQMPLSLSLKIVECLRFLCCHGRAVSPNGESISCKEIHEAVVASLAMFWLNILDPKLNSDAVKALASVERVASRDSLNLRRARSSSNKGGRSSVVFDQKHEVVALRELLEMAVSLIVCVAKRSDSATTPTLVEQVCALEVARPIAVREGILQILVGWLESENATTAATSMRYLTAVKDKYMAGWIHSEMVNKGAVSALAHLAGRSREVGPDVSLAIAHILASLCVAPHTRAAVVEEKCIGFLISFLPYESSESSSEEIVLSVGSALVQLAAGAITRATVLSGEDLEVLGSVSPDKSDSIVDEIVENGAILPLVSIARERHGKLRSVAVEALRVLSEDVSSTRQTRLRLCEAGAAGALGVVLKTDVSPLNMKQPLDEAFLAFSPDLLKQLHQALCALANILDPVQDSPRSRERRASSNWLEESRPVLIKGCLDTAKFGGLESILKIASLEFAPSIHQDGAVTFGMDLMEEACRSLASVSPLLLTDNVAKAGYSYGANDVLNTLYGVLKQIVDNADSATEVDEQVKDVHEVVLQGLASLAKSDPLKTRIVDKSLPYLMHSVVVRDAGTSDAVIQSFQLMDLTEDEIAVQVAGNNPSLLADWFCLQRSLLIQSMARAEIRQVIINNWEAALIAAENPEVTNLIRSCSDKRRSDDEISASSDLFEHFADDRGTAKKRDRLVRQYYDIFGKSDISNADDLETLRSAEYGPLKSDGLLSKQIYPLSSSSSEKEWILQHRKFTEEKQSSNDGSSRALSEHVAKLLDTCFPSRLLKEQILPISVLAPQASFNFRALMMPRRRYFSFRREGTLLSRICEKESSRLDGTDVHWSIGFTDSSFAGEFDESLVQFLYMCPLICGLSFSTTKEVEKEEEDSDGGSLLASLAGSLPAWISHLTFDGVFREDDLSILVKVLETMGTLSAVGQDLAKNSSGDVTTNTQGKFSFLAIRRVSYESGQVWIHFFDLIGSISKSAGSVAPKRPLAYLKSLDLSWNKLGDQLCAQIISIARQDSTCCLEELDLSGNNIKLGINVAKQLRVRRGTLRTLKLSWNGLGGTDVWLDIVKAVQHERCGIQILDLSSNDISLSDTQYEQRDILIHLLRENRKLVQLNLSDNKFSSKAVDEILYQLAEPNTVDCHLGFLLLDNNEPCLTPQQMDYLRSFSSRSRLALLNRYLKEREIKAEEPPATPVDNHEPNDEISLVSQETHDIVELPTTDNLITVLFSAPLIFWDNTRQERPFAKLNFEMERELIWQCLKEASRDIELSYDNATHDRLLATISKRCTCLHYSGHGHPEYLPFEDGMGGPKWFPVNEFRHLIERQGSAPFRFVFVSACFSGLAGQTFAAAGVPHVVCCQQEYELKDSAALAFTRQFYLALAVGNTVKESFEHGCRAVRATPNLRNAEEEMKKFVLLPENGNHDVPIFSAGRVPEWPRSLSELARRERRNRGQSREMSASRSAELAVRNLIQEDPSPAPPQFFLGREVDMYKVLQGILTRRLVSVVGERGIGRSSLVCAVCHYINERRNSIATKIERIYFLKVKQSRRKNMFAALVTQFLKRLVDEGRVDPMDGDEDTESIIETICSALRNVKALVVFHGVEFLDDQDEVNEFPMLLQRLCRETNNVKILLTNNAELGVSSLGEQHVRLGPINFENTVKLFANVCPHVHSRFERAKLLRNLVPEGEASLTYSKDLPNPTRGIFEMLGRGIPAIVENAAYCIDKNEHLPRLIDGSIRKDFFD